MGLFKDAPDSPDYRGAAIEQGESSEDVTRMQTYANRPDQYTPFGSSTWDAKRITDPSSGKQVTRWDQTVGLDPALQQALNYQQQLGAGRSAIGLGLMGKAAEELESPTGFFDSLPGVGATPDQPAYYGEGLTQMGTIPGQAATNPSLPEGPDPSTSLIRNFDDSTLGNPNTDLVNEDTTQSALNFDDAPTVGTGASTRNRVEDAYYDRATSRLDPQWEQRGAALESRLVNQGLRPGDAAYDTQMENFSRQKNDAYQGALHQSIMSGGQEATREFGMDLQGRQQDVGETTTMGNFANQAQQQAYLQALGEFGAENQAQQQAYDQQLGQAGFENQAQQQAFAQAAALRGEAGAGAGSKFQQAMAQSQYADQQRQQQVQEQLAFGNQAFQQGLQGAGFQNQLRQQAIAEQLQREGWSLNKINALMTGQQVGMPSMPNFAQATKAEPTQFLAAAKMQGEADLNRFSAEQQAMQGMMSGAGSLATGIGDYRSSKP